MKHILVWLTIWLTVSACGKTGEPTDQNRFPGFTQAGKDGESAKFFADLKSVKRDREGIVTFQMVRTITGGYVIQDARTDCRSFLQGNEGVKYRDDGTSEAKYPADKIQIDPQSQPGISSLVNLVCSKAEESRMIIGAFDDIKALEILYGPYLPEKKAALWKNMNVPKNIDSDKVFSVNQGLVSIITSSEFVESGVNKRMFLTATQPSDGSNECHACAPLINAAVFIKFGDKWRVEAHYPYLGFKGAYGAPPSMSWIQIGAEQFAFLIQSADMHMGVSSGYLTVCELYNKELNEILEIGISDSDDSDVARSLKISIGSLPKTGYAPINIDVLHKAEGKSDSVTTLHYIYQNGKYSTNDRLPDEDPPSITESANSNSADSQPLPAVQSTDKKIDVPAIKVGDSYTFETENITNQKLSYVATRVVAAIEGNRLTIVTTNAKSGNKRTNYYDRAWGYIGSGLGDKEGVIFSPPLKYLDYPLNVGKKWVAQSVETDKKTGRQRQHAVSGTVVGWEKISVPAGVFDALKIVLHTEVKDGENVSPGTDISWYVPSLRRSVKSELTGLDSATGMQEKKIVRLLSYQLQN